MFKHIIFYTFLAISFSKSIYAKEVEVNKYQNLSKYQLGGSLGYTNLKVEPASIEDEVLADGASKNTSFLPLNAKLFFRADVGGERTKGLFVETGFQYVGKYTAEYRAPDYMLDIYNQNFFGFVGLLKYIAMTMGSRFFLSGGMIYGKVMSGYQYDMGNDSSGSNTAGQQFGANGTNNSDVNFYLNFGFQFDIPNSPVGIELSYDYYPTFDGETTGDSVCLPSSTETIGGCVPSSKITYGDVRQYNVNLGVYYNIK